MRLQTVILIAYALVVSGAYLLALSLLEMNRMDRQVSQARAKTIKILALTSFNLMTLGGVIYTTSKVFINVLATK